MGGVPWGGSEFLWSKVAMLALKEGHEVALSVYDWDQQTNDVFKEFELKGARIEYRKRYSGNASILKKSRDYISSRLQSEGQRWKLISSFQPDYILINQGDAFDLVVHHLDLYRLIVRNQLKYSILLHSHPQFSYIPDKHILKYAKPVFSDAELCFFISRKQQKVVEKALLTKLVNARHTWNPLNLNKLEYILWPDDHIPSMAMVANLISGKGHDILLEILSTPLWKSRNWRLNFYGSGSGKGYLEELVRDYQLEDRVFFQGHVKSVTEIWKMNHVLLIPSSGEGMPISMMEALVSGRPVVSTKVGGIEEVIIENENGFLAEAPTVSSFGNALERAYLDKSKWKLLGENAYNDCITKVDLHPEITLLKLLTLKNT